MPCHQTQDDDILMIIHGKMHRMLDAVSSVGLRDMERDFYEKSFYVSGAAAAVVGDGDADAAAIEGFVKSSQHVNRKIIHTF